MPELYNNRFEQVRFYNDMIAVLRKQIQEVRSTEGKLSLVAQIQHIERTKYDVMRIGVAPPDEEQDDKP